MYIYQIKQSYLICKHTTPGASSHDNDHYMARPLRLFEQLAHYWKKNTKYGNKKSNFDSFFCKDLNSSTAIISIINNPPNAMYFGVKKKFRTFLQITLLRHK